MYSFILFLLTLTQLLVVGGSYYEQASYIFYMSAIYTSPIYASMMVLRADPSIGNPIYAASLGYHAVKYIIFFLAQRNEGHSGILITAIIFEAIYLCMSAYFMSYLT